MASSRTLLSLICVVLNTCQAVDYGWLSRKEFSFSLQGKDLVGLPQLKSQYAGFSYSGELRVQSHSPHILILKLFNMNYTKIHEELTEGWWDGPDSSSRNKTKPLPMPTSAVVVKMTQSTSPELIMEAGLDDWQVNFIKGMVSKVVAFLNDNSVTGPNSKKPSGSQQQDVFSVMEDSVVGRCEVLYEVNPLPSLLGLFSNKLCDNRQMWEITKTYNFSNCQMLSEDHAHLPSKDCTPGGANCGQFWSRASLTQMVGCGEMNNFVLLSSISSSVMNAHLHLQNDSQAIVNSNLNITLSSIMDLNRKFSLPQKKQTIKTLFYSYSKTPKDLYSRSCQDTAASGSEGEEGATNMHGKTKKRVDESEERGRLVRDKRLVRFGPMRKRTYNDQNNEDLFNESSEYHPTYHNTMTERYNRTDIDGNNFNTRMNKKSFIPWGKSSEDFSNELSDELQLEEQWNISGKEHQTEPPHQPFNMFYLAHRRSEDFNCLNQKLRQVIADIASDLEDINILPEKNVMDKLSLAVDICKSMPLDHLSSVSEDVFEIHSGHSVMKSKERNVFRDVVTMCGTHPAFQLIRGWIVRQQVEGEEAAQIIASLPTHIYSPSKDLLEEFFEMVQQIPQKDEEQLTITAVLALSNLVRQACVNERTRQSYFSSIIRPVCDPNFGRHVVDWLVHQLESDPNQSRVYVEALGNVGNTDIIQILGDIAVNPKYSSYIQTSAVFAMRYQGLRKSPAIPPLLMSLYHNYSLPVNTRIAAVALLAYSDPGLAIWQRLAISTWYEPSPAVAQFVALSIRSMATTMDTLYTHFSRSAKLVLPLCKPSKASPYKPYILVSSWHTSDFGRVVLEHLSWMQFFDFSNIYYRHVSRSCGFSRINIEASVTAANQDELWSALKELITSNSDYHSPQPSTKGITNSLAQLQELLNIRHRTMPHLQADVHLKINNMMERMLYINKDSLKTWVKGGRKMLLDVLSEGNTLSYQKADMDSFHISTTTDLGFPVEFKVRTPTIVQAKADLNMTEEGLVIGTAFVYSSQLLSSMGVMSPWDSTAHLAGAYATNFFQLPPFRVVVKIDSNFSELKLTSSYIDQHRLLYISMQPFTSQYKMTIHQPTLLSPGTTRIQLGETVQMPISWLSRYFKTVYSSEETENVNPMDFIQQARGVAGFSLVMPNMEAKSFETVMNPMHPVFMNFSMSMASKSNGLLEYESFWESFVRKVFNDFSKLKKSKEMPEQPLSAKNNLDPAPSNQSSKSTQNVDSIKNNGSIHGKSGSVMKPETKSLEDNKLINLPVNSERYQVYSTTYESATGNFNASEVNPFTNNVNGSSKSFLLEQTLSKINSGKAVVFEFSLYSSNQDQPINIAAFATYATTYSKRVDRFGLFLKKDLYQMRMTAVREDPIDIATDLSQRVNQDLQHNLFVDYVGAFSGQDVTVFTKASLGASRITLSQLRATSQLIECSQLDNQNFDSSVDMKCRRIHSQVKEIGFGNISVYYNEHGKFLENMAHMYMNAANVMIPRTEIKSGQGYNTMTLMFDFSPRTETVNVFITTPAKSINIHRLPLHNIPMSSMIEWSKQEISPEDYCGISPRRVRTFDGAQLDYQMHDDWQLVAYDFSGKYNFSVITRAANNNSLEVELNIRDQYLVSLVEGPIVHLNNNQQPLNGSHPLLRVIDQTGYLLAHIVHTPDNSIHINIPQDKLDLVYHGTTLIIKAEPILQGRLGGICGTYSNSGVEKFLTAQGTNAKSYKEFIQSYIIKKSKSTQVDDEHWSENV